MIIRFDIEGTPAGKPRPRATSFGGFTRVYSPKDAHGWETAVAFQAKRHAPAQPLDGPISLQLDLFFPRPKSHYLSSGKRRPTSPEMHTNKPDRDNCEKLILDVMTRLGFWKDDCQVCAGEVRKYYANNATGCSVVLETL